jgi:hypothetical protein
VLRRGRVRVAAVAGGFLAQHSYWFLFALDAATCLGFAVVIAVGLPETRPQGHDDVLLLGARIDARRTSMLDAATAS